MGGLLLENKILRLKHNKVIFKKTASRKEYEKKEEEKTVID